MTEVARWRVIGQSLTLFDGNGDMIAKFEAQAQQVQ